MGFRNHGSIDYKGTNFELFKQLRFEVFLKENKINLKINF